jgi:hypothetical protein
MPSTTRKQKIGLILFGLFLGVVLIEGGLRLGGFIFYSAQAHKNWQAIKQRGTYRILCLGESTTGLGLSRSLLIFSERRLVIGS